MSEFKDADLETQLLPPTPEQARAAALTLAESVLPDPCPADYEPSDADRTELRQLLQIAGVPPAPAS